MATLDSTRGTEYSSDSFEVGEEIELSSETDSNSAGEPSSNTKILVTKQKNGTGSANSKSASGALQQQLTKSRGKGDSHSKTFFLGHKSQAHVSNQTFHIMRGASTGGGESKLAAKSFRDSREVRDAVFDEWMARKSTLMSNERSAKAQERKQEEERKRKKEMEMAEHTSKAMERWTASKEAQLQEKHKQRSEEIKKQKAVVEEREQKQRTAELVSHKWREEKTKQLITKHQEKKRRARDEERRKQEEAAERVESAAQAFKVWSERKGEIMKAERKKEKQQISAMEHVEQEKAAERQQESRRTFEAWKSKKDERIRSTGTLYTYKEDSKAMRHQKPWCPARGVKYDYPKLKSNEMKPAKKTSRTGSAKSFYSESSTSLHSLVSDTASSAGNSRPVTSEGKLKTIQVCCQTLEYWCTCDNC